MAAVRTSLIASDLPENLKALRRRSKRQCLTGAPITAAAMTWAPGSSRPRIPARSGARSSPDITRSRASIPKLVATIIRRRIWELWAPVTISSRSVWTRSDRVWLMLHSGSRGIGNRIGSYFIELARKDLRNIISNLPDRDLAYLEEGSAHFNEYVEAVAWAQTYARLNRELMMAGGYRGGRVRSRHPPVHHQRRGGELSSQLCRARDAFRRGSFRHPKRRGARGRRRPRDHSRKHGCALLYRKRIREIRTAS